MKKLVVTMFRSKITKGAVAYAEKGWGEGGTLDDFTIGSIYIRKKHLEGDGPAKIKVTVDKVA